jgi:antitoxin component of MazEF toxin-antitoxin module
MPGSESGALTRVSDSGKLNLPSHLRKMVGLEKGGPVMIRFENGELRIRTVRSILEELQREAQALFAGSGESVNKFLADRRAEAAAEENEG